MYAIFRSGSKQYRVKKGDVISVDHMDPPANNSISFQEVLLLNTGEGTPRIGAPTVPGCVVKGEFLGPSQGPKITSLKYKRRKNNYRKFGHRQHYAQVRITDIIV